MAAGLFLKALGYFAICFTVYNLWLMAELRSAARSEDEVRKGRVLLKGIVTHFAYSLLIIIVYYKFIYTGSRMEVLIAMGVYIVSLIQYVAAASRMK